MNRSSSRRGGLTGDRNRGVRAQEFGSESTVENGCGSAAVARLRGDLPAAQLRDSGS